MDGDGSPHSPELPAGSSPPPTAAHGVTDECKSELSHVAREANNVEGQVQSFSPPGGPVEPEPTIAAAVRFNDDHTVLVVARGESDGVTEDYNYRGTIVGSESNNDVSQSDLGISVMSNSNMTNNSQGNTPMPFYRKDQNASEDEGDNCQKTITPSPVYKPGSSPVPVAHFRNLAAARGRGIANNATNNKALETVDEDVPVIDGAGNKVDTARAESVRTNNRRPDTALPRTTAVEYHKALQVRGLWKFFVALLILHVAQVAPIFTLADKDRIFFHALRPKVRCILFIAAKILMLMRLLCRAFK
jgi:hypothetical protein